MKIRDIIREEKELQRRLGEVPNALAGGITSRELFEKLAGFRAFDHPRDVLSGLASPGLTTDIIQDRFDEMRRHQIDKQIGMLNDAYASPIHRALREANDAFSSIAKDLTSNHYAIERLTGAASVGAVEWSKFRDAIAPDIAVDAFAGSYLAKVNQLSLLTEGVVGRLIDSQLSPAIDFSGDLKTSFRAGFEDLTNSYKNLFDSYSKDSFDFLNIKPSLIQFPTIEVFNSALLYQSAYLETDHADEFEDESNQASAEIEVSTDYLLADYLEAVNPGLINLLEGAKLALESNNPDKVRHSLVSLRELFREVLYFLSPEEELRSWSISDDDFSNNRPTRRARLRYITRDVGYGSLETFFEKDIESMLASIKVFHTATHVIASDLTKKQVSALIQRVEGTLLFLFSVGGSDH